MSFDLSSSNKDESSSLTESTGTQKNTTGDSSADSHKQQSTSTKKKTSKHSDNVSSKPDKLSSSKSSTKKNSKSDKRVQDDSDVSDNQSDDSESESEPVVSKKQKTKGAKIKNAGQSLAKRHSKLKVLELSGSNIVAPKGRFRLTRQCGVKSIRKRYSCEVLGLIATALLAESIRKSAIVAQGRAAKKGKKSSGCFTIKNKDIKFVVNGKLYPENDEFKTVQEKIKHKKPTEAGRLKVLKMQEGKAKKRKEREQLAMEQEATTTD